MSVDVPDSNEKIENNGKIPYIVEIGGGGYDVKSNSSMRGIKSFKSKGVERKDLFNGEFGMFGYAKSDEDKGLVDSIIIGNVFGCPYAKVSESVDDVLNSYNKNITKEGLRNLEVLFSGIYEKLKPGGIILIHETTTPEIAYYLKYFDFNSLGIKSKLLLWDYDSAFSEDGNKDGRKPVFKDSALNDFDCLSDISQKMIKNDFDYLNRINIGMLMKCHAKFLLVLYKPLDEGELEKNK